MGGHRVKIITCGNQEVGKSCLIKRHCEKRYVTKYLMTIGIDYGVTRERAQDLELKVNIFDMGGNPNFYEIRNEFYKDAQGVLLVYDIGDLKSFHCLETIWLAELEEDFPTREAMSQLVVIVCGTKSDTKHRQVSTSEGQAFADRNGFYFFETSAATGTNVKEAFDTLFGDIALAIQGKRQPLRRHINNNPLTSSTTAKPITDEQKTTMSKINSARDDYARLGLTRAATREDVVKAYRRIAVLIHPDKCGAPEASEAFKTALLARDALLRKLENS